MEKDRQKCTDISSLYLFVYCFIRQNSISLLMTNFTKNLRRIFFWSQLWPNFFFFFCYIWMFQRRLIFSTTRRIIFLNCFDSQLLFHFTILVSTPLVSLLNQITGSPCQQYWKFLENGVEMIHTDNRRWMVMDGKDYHGLKVRAMYLKNKK